MRPQQIEAWVLDLVEAVTRGRHVEDDRVEFKSVWPEDHSKTARQIAGQANAARSENILWVIGVDEKTGRVLGAGHQELANWWPQVERWFSEVPPGLASLQVPTPVGKSVVALLLQTDRSPYVVKTPQSSGAVEREIPWRSGNRTRSASRAETLSSVVAEAVAPQVEVISAVVAISVLPATTGNPDLHLDPVPERLSLYGEVEMYLDVSAPVTFPQHRWSCHVAFGRTHRIAVRADFKGPQMPVGTTSIGTARFEPRGFIEAVPGSGVHVQGSDVLTMSVRNQILEAALKSAVRRLRTCRVEVRLPISRSERVVAVDMTLRCADEVLQRSRYDGAGTPSLAVWTHDGSPWRRY